MKEYKVEVIKYGINSEKNYMKIEELLNSMASQGWELSFIPGTGAIYIFQREK
jgi:hypothetical protein